MKLIIYEVLIAGKLQKSYDSRKMKVALILLLAILAGTQAKKNPATGNLFSRFEPHIRHASDQHDATKLCAIREELEKEEFDSEKTRLIEFLDNTASSKFAFDPSACSKELDLDNTFEKTGESSEKFGQRPQEAKQNSSIDLNGIRFLKEFEMNDFGQTNEDLSTSPSLSDKLDIQAILEPIATVLIESDRVTEDEKDDAVDRVGMDDSISNTDQFECAGCEKDCEKDNIVEITRRDNKEQTSAEMNKLVTKVVGIVFAIIVLIIILCFLIASCHRRRRSETLPQFHDQNEPAQRYQNFE